MAIGYTNPGWANGSAPAITGGVGGTLTDLSDAVALISTAIDAGTTATATKVYNDKNTSVASGGISANFAFASGYGIDFSATSDGSGTMSSELLDDYEEGTWTPAFSAATPGSPTLPVQFGRYTKVGNRVHINGYLTMSAKGGMTGNALKITGLPYAIATISNNFGAGCVTDYLGFTFGAGRTQLCMFFQTNSSYISLKAAGSAVSVDALTATSSVADAAEIVFSATYLTA